MTVKVSGPQNKKPAVRRVFAFAVGRLIVSDGLDVRRLLALLTLGDLETYLLTFRQ
jgi:hypothetical protein